MLASIVQVLLTDVHWSLAKRILEKFESRKTCDLSTCHDKRNVNGLIKARDGVPTSSISGRKPKKLERFNAHQIGL